MAPCATVDAALARLRGAQAEFLLAGILLEIDVDAFAVDHGRHAAARASRPARPPTSCGPPLNRTSPPPERWRAQARASAKQIASLTIGDVERINASIATCHRLAPAFGPLLAAQVLACQQQGTESDQPLFLAPDGKRAATARHIDNWLARVGRDTGLRFDRAAGWNRYTTPAWATFRGLEALQLAHDPAVRRPTVSDARAVERHPAADDRIVAALLASVRESHAPHSGSPARSAGLSHEPPTRSTDSR